MKERLGSIIEGQIESQDENTLYTQNFMARQKSKICGAFSAITRLICYFIFVHTCTRPTVLITYKRLLINV